MSDFLNTVRDTMSILDQGIISPEEAECVIKSHAVDSVRTDKDMESTLNWLNLRAFLEMEAERWEPLQKKFLANVWPMNSVPNAADVLRERFRAFTCARSLRDCLAWLLPGTPRWLVLTATRLSSD